VHCEVNNFEITSTLNNISNSILRYESYKKHFIARTVLEHDERSEECPKGVSAIKCLINEMSYSIFSTLPLFQ
jgi:hypothetical protein